MVINMKKGDYFLKKLCLKLHYLIFKVTKKEDILEKQIRLC